MPGIVKVKVLEGRNLPVMDKSADTTDAYVEIKLGNITYKTDVCRKSLNPQWNSEWYKFEMDDAELQDEPLQVRLMDHDTYSANDMIGKVYFNLNPLLLNNANETRYTMLKSSHSASPGPGCISGWFPVYDTIHGLRGEINLIIRLELFPDLNKYRQSSCGIHVFNCSMIPYGYYTEYIYGFVEELIVEDDPEYQWIEKIRTPRASNEARQTMFYKMSGEVQRKIGLKVIDSGGNAIIGYKQYFDLEGETGGVVVRGIGTAVKLSRCKQLDTVSGRPSLKYQIPSLTITDAFANTSFQSDDCSIISGSSQSDNYLSDVPNDRWSLCSFGSRASCQSRYTSIETLLDQKNRKPIAKGSKFLNVARYFTSSKMKRTFSRKKKQKSLHALRKFSIIEEYKQKSNANIGSEIDEMIEESLNLSNFSASKASLKRISTVEEPISCQIFENENSSRNQYFDLSGPHINLKQKDDEIFELEDVVRDKKNEENEKLLLADDMELKVIEKIEACMISEKCVDEESKEVESFEKSISSDSESLISQKLNRCLTPPISEMTPYCMTPPLRDMNSVNPLIEKELKKVKSVEFGKSFLKKLKRQHIIDHYPISDSPEIKKLIEWNEEHKQNTSNSVESNKTIFHKVPVNIKKDKRPRSISECLSDENPCSFDFNDLWEFNQSSPVNSSNNSEFTFFNEKNSDFPVTTADDISNILPQALTPSCLLMHANNSDRNASECDKDLDENVSNTPKRESVSSVDHVTKKRPSLPDTSAIVSKNFDINKDCDSTPSNVTVHNMGSNIIHKENIELMEYPFLTLSIYPDDFIVHLGGTVSVRSVKLLARISNIEEPETRDAWWRELRIEIKSHMKALACNVVLNYTESTAICDEVCVLSATGTAAIVKIYDGSSPSLSDYLLRSTNPKLTDKDNEVFMTKEKVPTENASSEEINCSIYHIPYRKASLPLSVKIKMCAICKKGFVTDVLLVTIEPFDKMPVIGQAAFIHASVCRLKRDSKSELNARDISDCLPFLEYKLNRQLINKLRVKGMNAIFGLNVQVSIGEKMVSAYATGTAVLLSVLPSPSEVTIAGWAPTQSSASNKKLDDARKLLEDTVKKNKIHYQLLEAIPEVVKTSGYEAAGQDYYPDIQYSAGSKQTCAIEIEDEDNVDAVTQLIDPNPPQGFLVSATEKIIFGSLPYIPKKNIQFFTQVYRYRIPNYSTTNFNKLFYKIVQSLYMKVHNRIPCSLNRVSFKMDIPEPDELQIRIIGMALALKESEKALESISTSCSSVSELSDDLILNSNTEKDLEQIDALCTFTPRKQITKKRNELHDNEIHITSLSYIPGANINLYLGNLNFVFIRESTMVKEPTGVVNNFVNSFMSDVTLMVKSHAAGIGGNAVVNFFVNECLLITHSHKNQGQCLINVGGDVVRYVPKNYRMDL